jgi:hypothetical protein
VTLDAFIDGAADTLILLGIFCTALFSVFRVGRWVQTLLDSQQSLRQAFDDHIADETIRLDRIDKQIGKLQGICENGNRRG